MLLHIAATVAVGLRVLTRPRMEPSVRLAWIMIVEALPLVGVIGYLLFGEIRMNRGEAKRRADIRRLLIVGAMSVIRWVIRKGGSTNRWLAALVARKPNMVAAVALANKMARMIWAMSTRQENYRMA